MILYNILKNGVVIKVTPRVSYIKWDGQTDHARVVDKDQATGVLVDTTIYNVLDGPNSVPGADTVQIVPVTLEDTGSNNSSSGNSGSVSEDITNNILERLRAVENILMANYGNLVFQDSISKDPWVEIYTQRIMENTAIFDDVPSDISANVLNELTARNYENNPEGGD